MHHDVISKIHNIECKQTMEQFYVDEIAHLVVSENMEQDEQDMVYMYLILQGIGFFMLAEEKLSDTGYVYQALEKYKKINMFIAADNTMQADRENIARFDRLSDAAFELTALVPADKAGHNKYIQSLLSLAFDRYQAETQALKDRLAIYDGHLLEQAETRRAEKSADISTMCWMLPQEEKVRYLNLIQKKNKLLSEKWSCIRQMQLYEETEKSYENRIIGRKRAQQITVEASALKKEQQDALADTLPKLESVHLEIMELLQEVQ